jgi:hypothetical protein
LLRAGTILLATMWPDEYTTRVVPRVPHDGDQHARSRELLDLAQTFDVADTFTASEIERARNLAAADDRIRVPLASA